VFWRKHATGKIIATASDAIENYAGILELHHVASLFIEDLVNAT
jgi:hypothetical protein